MTGTKTDIRDVRMSSGCIDTKQKQARPLQKQALQKMEMGTQLMEPVIKGSC